MLPGGPSKSIAGIGLGLCLIASAGAHAGESMKLRNAQTEPLNFATLEGWKDDDHATAFEAYLKSCAAILQGSKAMRAARPVYGELFKVCERAQDAGKLDREQARKFFETNFSPVRVT